MKKIGVIFVLFGIFFPIVLLFYTEFKQDIWISGKGIGLKNIRSGVVCKISIKDAVYYTDLEYEEIKKIREQESKEIEKRLKTVADPKERLRLILESLPDPPKIKTPGVEITIRYVDCLVFSIVIFGIGLGFLLLSKKKSSHTEGGKPLTH